MGIHTPLDVDTERLIDAEAIAKMKPTAVLINAARGPIVDEAALADSLKSGHLGGAAIDVYSQEPPAADSPLLGLEGDAARRVLFTPHVAGVTRQSTAFLLRAAWRNVERVLILNAPPLDRAW